MSGRSFILLVDRGRGVRAGQDHAQADRHALQPERFTIFRARHVSRVAGATPSTFPARGPGEGASASEMFRRRGRPHHRIRSPHGRSPCRAGTESPSTRPRHFVTTAPRLEQAMKAIEEELDEAAPGIVRRKQASRGATAGTAHALRPGDDAGDRVSAPASKNYSMHLSGRFPRAKRPFCLFRLLPQRLPCWSSTSRTSSLPQLRAMYNGDRSRKTTLVEHGFPPAHRRWTNRPLTFDEYDSMIKPGDLRVCDAGPTTS